MDDLSPLIGDNRPRPSEDAVASVRDMLRQYEARVEAMLKAFALVKVRNRGEASKATDLVGMAKDIRREIEQQRLAITRPYDEAVTAAIATERNFCLSIEEKITEAEDLLDQFDKLEADRAAAQRREQEEAEAALRGAASPAGPRPEINYSAPAADAVTSPVALAKPAPIRGDYGKRFTRRQHVEVEVTDVARIPSEILNTDAVREAIARAIVQLARANSRLEVPGALIHRGTRGSVN